jgi:alkylation response protein AidB-like acyl-CoA dehydrogenase
VKVYGSEALDYVVDEGVQIHGGFGFHQDYAVERAYRDSRINRIFEGTNEINRLLITGMLLKRAARGQVALMAAAERLIEEELQAGEITARDTDDEMHLVRNAKRIALLALGLAYQTYQSRLEKQQEVLMCLADIVMESFAMESSLLRARKLSTTGKARAAADICAVFLRDAMARVEMAARNVLGTCSPLESLPRDMSVLRKLAAYDPVDAVSLRRNVAARVLARERYSV